MYYFTKKKYNFTHSAVYIYIYFTQNLICEFELPDVSLRCFVVRQLLTCIYALSSVKFSVLKLWLCKKSDKYEVWNDDKNDNKNDRNDDVSPKENGSRWSFVCCQLGVTDQRRRQLPGEKTSHCQKSHCDEKTSHCLMKRTQSVA